MRTTLMAGAGLIAASLGGVALPATAQGLPPGSYQKTCTVLSIDAGRQVMTAQCKEKGTDHGFSPLAYVVFPPLLQAELIPDSEGGWGNNRNFPYGECIGDIANLDGKLSCTWDMVKVKARLQAEADAKAAADKSAAAQAKAAADLKYQMDMNEQFFAATPGLRAASVLVLGHDMGNVESRHMLGVARSLVHPETRAAIMNKEFDFGTASRFLRDYIAKKSGEYYRNGAIEAAFFQVYGRPSTPQEQIGYYAQIDAGKAWYATIVTDEMKKIAAGSAARDEVIDRVAKDALGRPASAEETGRWKASGQNYGTMVEGVRQGLWSGSRPDDLVVTVSRALTKVGRPSDPEAVKTAVAAWRPMEPVYAEMISPAGRAKLTAAVDNGRPALIRR